MWNKKTKINTVIWGDLDKTLFEVFFENGDVVMISSTSTDWLASKIRKQYKPDVIDGLTNDYHKYTGERTILFEEFMENYSSWKKWKNDKNEELVKTSDNILSDILDIHNDKQRFFKLKLEIFERPEVNTSTDRAWKSSLRKAATALELLNLLYSKLPDLSNAPSESPEKIPLQDITNQPDNQDSN